MNTLIVVAIAPFGVGDELAQEVAEVVKVIRESGLTNRTNAMFTEIEGGRSDAGSGRRDVCACEQRYSHGGDIESRYPPGIYKYDANKGSEGRGIFRRRKMSIRGHLDSSAC